MKCVLYFVRMPRFLTARCSAVSFFVSFVFPYSAVVYRTELDPLHALHRVSRQVDTGAAHVSLPARSCIVGIVLRTIARCLSAFGDVGIFRLFQFHLDVLFMTPPQFIFTSFSQNTSQQSFLQICRCTDM